MTNREQWEDAGFSFDLMPTAGGCAQVQVYCGGTQVGPDERPTSQLGGDLDFERAVEGALKTKEPSYIEGCLKELATQGKPMWCDSHVKACLMKWCSDLTSTGSNLRANAQAWLEACSAWQGQKHTADTGVMCRYANFADMIIEALGKGGGELLDMLPVVVSTELIPSTVDIGTEVPGTRYGEAALFATPCYIQDVEPLAFIRGAVQLGIRSLGGATTETGARWATADKMIEELYREKLHVRYMDEMELRAAASHVMGESLEEPLNTWCQISGELINGLLI